MIVLAGVGAGLTFPAVSGAAVMSVPGERYALASALNAVARQIGAALGVAVLVAILGDAHGLGALAAFRHGWAFAGGCLLLGGAVCLPLVLRAPAGIPRTAGRRVAAAGAASAAEGT